jgi:uncharacterized protein DUF4259
MMGAWDVGSFGNDTACDWSYGLEGAKDLGYVEQTLDAVLRHGKNSVPADEAECAVAAAEVIARLNGHWGIENSYTETADNWVRSHALTPSPALVAKAVAVLDRIIVAPSELLELWEEGTDDAGWTDAVTELKHRVEA